MQDAVIIGAGGFARETLDVFDAVNAVKPTFNVIGYIVEQAYGDPGTQINDKPILGDMDWFLQYPKVQAICGVGAPELRRRLISRAQEYRVEFCTLVHPNAVLTRWVKIGVGTIITAGCILTNQITIGDHVHLNLDCTVGHDAVLEDFVTVAPGVHISGNARLETGAYLGTGANILEKKTIGMWSVVGAGSAIVQDVPANSTVVGVPGKVIKTREDGWHLL
jgi:sugar O-acyltransferase (sialic acid O-acetyltransferase NeuD family)